MAGASDAKVFDAQAAAEAALTLFDEMLNGANLIHDVGYLDCATTGSLEFLAFCADVIGWLRRYFRKLEVSEETLALDLIHRVGPDGHFIEAQHTLHHVREDWRPTLFDRLDYHRWSAKGAQDCQQRAKARVREIVENHRAEPLSKDIIEKLDSILNTA
jgi:trimethylamine--corrinoid protein Co-methyltransferase